MRFLVLGAGAIGGYVGGKMVDMDCRVNARPTTLGPEQVNRAIGDFLHG